MFIPASAQSRFLLQEKHSEVLASLFLNFGIDYEQAQRMRQSNVRSIFQSKTFGEWKKNREAVQKVDLAVIDRLDALIKAVGHLTKAVSR